MPLQNRVYPWGALCAVSDRGTLMGNRGIFAQKQITKPWVHKAWVACLLSYKDSPSRGVFGEGTYSELFFLDEATALFRIAIHPPKILRTTGNSV